MLAQQNPAVDDIWNSADDSLGQPAKSAGGPVGGGKEHEIPPEVEPVLQEISHEPVELEHQQELQEQGLIERIHQEGELMEKARELGIEAEQKELVPMDIGEPKLNLPLGEDQILVQKKGPTDNSLTWLAMWAFVQILKYWKHLGYAVKVMKGKIIKKK